MSTPTDAQPDSATRRRRSYARHLVRGMMLIVAVLLLSTYGESWLAVVPAASPLTAIASAAATRTFQATMWIGLSVAVVVAVRHRLFCRWVCPTGTCADCVATLSRGRRRRGPRLPAAGQWIALLILGGAAFEYPLLLWLDPLALFCSLFGVPDAATMRDAMWCAAGMVVVGIVSVVWPGTWCARLCPLGGLSG